MQSATTMSEIQNLDDELIESTDAGTCTDSVSDKEREVEERRISLQTTEHHPHLILSYQNKKKNKADK